jgi:hypothetical protein
MEKFGEKKDFCEEFIRSKKLIEESEVIGRETHFANFLLKLKSKGWKLGIR